jgi:hypothetical protein
VRSIPGTNLQAVRGLASDARLNHDPGESPALGEAFERVFAVYVSLVSSWWPCSAETTFPLCSTG